ncbi:MAG: hypothetical protein ACQKBU_09435 [Verrucomicrobiales bacterium]
MEATPPHLPAELDRIVSRSHLATTPLGWLPAEGIPSPFHQLLVHDHDMTSELERFHEDTLTLAVMDAEQTGGLYLREVTLHTSTTKKPVEYGLIEILLDHFPVDLRSRITAGATPLGALLNESGLQYYSKPQGFFSVPAPCLKAVFPPSTHGEILYGRYNHLMRHDGDLCLARILEILPH